MELKHRALKHELALFDFDGTLADSLPWLNGAMARLAKQFNFHMPTPAEVERMRDSPPSSILSGMGIPVWKMPRIAAAMRRLMAEEIESIRLFDGMEPFLRQVRARGVRLGIVSSNGEANVRKVLGPESARLFGHYECGVSIFGKAAKLRRAAKAAGVSAFEAIYVGDEIRDLDAAAKAGMPFGAVGWGMSTVAAFASRKPRAIFRTIAEMEAYLAS